MAKVQETGLTVSGRSVDNLLRRSLRARLKKAEGTAKRLRRLQLFDSDEIRATRLSELTTAKKGRWETIDPVLQIVLTARDEFQKADDPKVRLGYFKAMQELYLAIDKRNGEELLQLVGLAQRQSHHQDEMEVKRLKSGEEPSDAELEALAKQVQVEVVQEAS